MNGTEAPRFDADPQPVSLARMAEARGLLHELLDELGLAGYRLQLELREELWQLGVECRADGGWRFFRLVLSASALEAAAENSAAREDVRDTLAETLTPCEPGT